MSVSDPLSTYRDVTEALSSGKVKDGCLIKHIKKTGIKTAEGELLSESTYVVEDDTELQQQQVFERMVQALVKRTLNPTQYRDERLRSKLLAVARERLSKKLKDDFEEMEEVCVELPCRPSSRKSPRTVPPTVRQSSYDKFKAKSKSPSRPSTARGISREKSVNDELGLNPPGDSTKENTNKEAERRSSDRCLQRINVQSTSFVPAKKRCGSRSKSARNASKTKYVFARGVSRAAVPRNAWVVPESVSALYRPPMRRTRSAMSYRQPNVLPSEKRHRMMHIKVKKSKVSSKPEKIPTPKETKEIKSGKASSPDPTPRRSERRISRSVSPETLVNSPKLLEMLLEQLERRKHPPSWYRREPTILHTNNGPSRTVMTFRFQEPERQLLGDETVRSSDVLIEQQPSGGNTLVVFHKRVSPGDVFELVSCRRRGFPLGLTLYVDGRTDSVLSACCEYKYRRGAKAGRFVLLTVSRGPRCDKCQRQKDLRDRKRLLNEMKFRLRAGEFWSSSESDDVEPVEDDMLKVVPSPYYESKQQIDSSGDEMPDTFTEYSEEHGPRSLCSFLTSPRCSITYSSDFSRDGLSATQLQWLVDARSDLYSPSEGSRSEVSRHAAAGPRPSRQRRLSSTAEPIYSLRLEGDSDDSEYSFLQNLNAQRKKQRWPYDERSTKCEKPVYMVNRSGIVTSYRTSNNAGGNKLTKEFAAIREGRAKEGEESHSDSDYSDDVKYDVQNRPRMHVKEGGQRSLRVLVHTRKGTRCKHEEIAYKGTFGAGWQDMGVWRNY